ncbi:MAG TPA: hypothetical protein VFY40_18805 [Blastocatellia bacterium]|nr:hypothetical protein [Blastocatellia bacterium]
MHATEQAPSAHKGLELFERNRYFFGKMLDEFHFRLETDYHNGKRRLINRAVLGYGVVCGLDVIPAEDQPEAIIVTPGFAIDKWGREIIVPEATRPIQIPPDVIAKARRKDEDAEFYAQRQEKHHRHDDDACIQVMICYHECETDPAPVLAGDCHSAEVCAPGVIREGYRIKFTPWCDHSNNDQCQIPHIVSEGRIDYEALVKWVTRERDCLTTPKDPCIRLAHIRLSDGHCDPEQIDITVRPIVYTNDLLFDILLGWQSHVHGWRDK